MLCLSCSGPGSPICGVCRRSLRPVPGSTTPGGLAVRSWVEHDGSARRLVHRLKYEGVAAIAAVAGERLAARVPPGAACLVPIPRVLARRIRYGIDPADEVALVVSRLAGIPRVRALRAPVWSVSSAGSSRLDRRGTEFTVRARPRGVVLVDDVVTTGRTLDSAATALRGVVGALTVTAVR